MVPRLMLQMILSLRPDWEIRVMDIKDAFFMAWQPEDEASGIIYKDKRYRLIRCLTRTKDGSKAMVYAVPWSDGGTRRSGGRHAADTVPDEQLVGQRPRR